MTKKIIAALLALLMAVSVFGCGTDEKPQTTVTTENSTSIPVPPEQVPPSPEEEPSTESTAPATPTIPEEPELENPNPGEPEPSVTETPEEPEVPEPEMPSTTPQAPTPDSETEEPEPTPQPAPQEKPAEVKPTKISATVSGSHLIGDTLKTSDFTVKVTMSDGSVLTNPSGWAASTMKLTSSSTKITVTYKSVSTTVTVSAKLGAINGMDVTEEALKYIGLAYVSGGNSLTKGTDCSGFTKLIFAKFGIDLPRTPSAQNNIGTKITAAEAKPGDLLVETYPEGQKYDGHAGIYIGGGKMISAMPGDGVIIETVHSGMDYLRVYENSYAGTDEDAYFDCLEALIGLGHTGEYRGCNVDWAAGKAVFSGYAPNGSLENRTLRLDLNDPKDGYESLLEAWKKVHLATGIYINIPKETENGTTDTYAYLNGQWVSGFELQEMVDAGQLTRGERYAAEEFYGAFWNSNAVITTGLGEKVDLSTCPGITNYSVIARPGNANEGKKSMIPAGSTPCDNGHRWEYGDAIEGTNDFYAVCWYCDKTEIDSKSVKNHTHTIYKTYFNGGYFEDSYVEYDCLYCGYRKEYVINGSQGANHDHDYSYNVDVYEPTCCMDGYTLHQCICGLSKKDNIKQCDGHNYGNVTTEDGYKVKTCKECGHKHKEK